MQGSLRSFVEAEHLSGRDKRLLSLLVCPRTSAGGLVICVADEP